MILVCRRYDRAEEDAESEEEEDDDADEIEFSDDESEAAWRRQQRAAEPSKRKMPQPGPAYVLPNGVHLLPFASPAVWSVHVCCFELYATMAGRYINVMMHPPWTGWQLVPSPRMPAHLSADVADLTIPRSLRWHAWRCGWVYLVPRQRVEGCINRLVRRLLDANAGSERGRGRSQRGRFDGPARGPGRGRMQSRHSAERGRARGHPSSGRGRGESQGGRAGRSAPFQNGQGQHSQIQNGAAFPLTKQWDRQS